MDSFEGSAASPVPESAPPAPKVEVEVVAAEQVNYAMVHSGVPLVAAVRVRNVGGSSIVGAELSIQLTPDLGDPTVFRVPLLKPGESWEAGPLDVRLPHARLRAINEAETGSLQFLVRVGDAVLAKGQRAFRLLAFNEWPGGTTPPGLLAVFVTPNHPAVATVLRLARDILGRETGDDAFSGYQAKSPKRALDQARAVYAAVQQLGISYIGIPASFEEIGQKVRLPDQVLAERMGNCLDLSLLFAACLEQIGLAPLLILVQGHAFCAVWVTDETFPEGVVDDVARLRNQIELRNVIAFDSTTVISGSRPPMEEAVRAARVHLFERDSFRLALDVRAVRKGESGFLPLPVRAPGSGDPLEALEASTARPAAFQGELDADLGEADALAAAQRTRDQGPTDPVTRRIQKWRERLLDLSLRNRLLNFRPTRGVIPLEVPDLAAFEDALGQDVDFEILPQPLVDSSDQRSKVLVEERRDPNEERQRLRTELEARRLHATLQPDELISTGRKLSRLARTDLEEGGANTLFAVIGILKWYESDSSDGVRYAPLLLIPTKLDYEPRRDRIRMRRSDDDVLGNISLAEKMKTDFRLDLSVLSDPPTDEHGVDVPLVIRSVRDAIQSMRRWEVLEGACVGHFTFGKFLMWNDLGANAEALLANPIVKHLAEGGQKPFPDSVRVPEERSLDAEVSAVDLPTVRDADSTQLKAIVAALRGRSFVLQGPPGTGKSQTITNLIAAALAVNKTVLFVSEKMAALEVVHRRLKEAGLDEFCLELHSNKSNKKLVLESLARAFHGRTSAAVDGFQENAGRLDKLRAHLNDYVRVLHQPYPIGMSFFRAWTQVQCAEGDRAPIALGLPVALDLPQERFRALVRAASDLSLPSGKVEPVGVHPWKDSAVAGWRSTVEASVRDALMAVRTTLSDLVTQVDELWRVVGDAGTQTLDGIEAAAGAASLLAKGRVPACGLSEGFSSFAEQARKSIDVLGSDEHDRREILTRWKAGIFSLGADLDDLRGRFERFGGKGPIVRFFRLRQARRRLATLWTGVAPASPVIASDLAIVTRLSRPGSRG